MKKEIEIKFKIAGILARPENDLLDRSKKLTDIYKVLEEQLILSSVSHHRELLIAFSECVVKGVTKKGHEEVVDYFLNKQSNL